MFEDWPDENAEGTFYNVTNELFGKNAFKKYTKIYNKKVSLLK